MVSREQKRAALLHEKLQLLRSITNSHAVNKTSIIIDASKYIEELKEKVERLNQEIAASAETSNHHHHHHHNPNLPMVTVETLEKGFMINVISARSCQGLLVSILEAFEEMGLTVLEARVSCTDTFRFQAVGGENDEQGETVDAQAVKQAVGQAIKNWSQQSTDQD